MATLRDSEGPEPGTMPGGTAEHGASAGELVSRATRQISELVHKEMALAKAELADKGKQAGVGAGLFGGAGLIAVYAGATLIGAAVAGLAVVWPTWLSALVIGVVLLAIAGVLALVGRKRMGRAVPPMPTRTAKSVQADVHEIKEHISERHSR